MAARCAFTPGRGMRFFVGWRLTPYPTYILPFVARAALEDEARDGKHDEILSAPSREFTQRKPRSRQTRPGFFIAILPA
jgi:hypothetical protein